MKQKPAIKQIDYVEMEAVVTHCLSNGMFRVRLKNGFRAMVHLSGKIRRFKIKITLRDRVVVHLSPYDLKRGRIVYRFADPVPVWKISPFTGWKKPKPKSE